MNVWDTELISNNGQHYLTLGNARIPVDKSSLAARGLQGPIKAGIRPEHIVPAASDEPHAVRMKISILENTGREVAFRLLKEGQRLKHDDVVFISDELVIAIEILPSDVIVLSPKTLPEMARACYEIGNKHSPLFLDGDEVTLPYDKPMFEWLQAAGFHPQKAERRLSQALRANSAQGHGHSHSHSHDHHDYHHHGDGNWHQH